MENTSPIFDKTLEGFSCEEVLKFLEDNSLESKYINLFKENEVNGANLLSFAQKPKFGPLNIPAGPCDTILKAITAKSSFYFHVICNEDRITVSSKITMNSLKDAIVQRCRLPSLKFTLAHKVVDEFFPIESDEQLDSHKGYALYVRFPDAQNYTRINNKVRLPLQLEQLLTSSQNQFSYYGGSNFFSGTKRVEDTILSFSKSRSTDPSQRKDVILVVGSPKSGKTTISKQIIPELLSKLPNIWNCLISDHPPNKDSPICTYYVDLLPLYKTSGVNAKLEAFYDSLCVEFKCDIKEDHQWGNKLLLLCRRISEHKRVVVTLDEYQGLFAGLNASEFQQVSLFIRNLVLDDKSNCQFIISGSTQAVLLYQLEQHHVNGLSMFRSPAVHITDLNSDRNLLEDTCKILNHFYSFNIASFFDEIKHELGFVNCAALHQIVREIKSLPTSEDADCLKQAVYNFKRRALEIYSRDCSLFFKDTPEAVSYIYRFLQGVRDLDIPKAWTSFLHKKGSLFYIRCPLFTAYLSVNITINKSRKPEWKPKGDDHILSKSDHLILISPLIPIYQAILDDRWQLENFEAWMNKNYIPHATTTFRTALSTYKKGAENNNHTTDLMYARVIAYHDGCKELTNLSSLATAAIEYYGRGEPNTLQKTLDDILSTYVDGSQPVKFDKRNKDKINKIRAFLEEDAPE